MNIEKLEFELTQLNDKPVVLVAPAFGHVSFSYSGKLAVVYTLERTVGFHLNGCGIAIIFFADDVKKLEEPSATCDVHIIRLKGPQDYKEKYEMV